MEVDEPAVGNCSVTWTMVQWVDYYMVYVNRDDEAEEQCNTTNTNCYFHCDCGYTYMTTVFAYNVAGASPPGSVLNYTTGVSLINSSFIAVHNSIHFMLESACFIN